MLRRFHREPTFRIVECTDVEHGRQRRASLDLFDVGDDQSSPVFEERHSNEQIADPSSKCLGGRIGFFLPTEKEAEIRPLAKFRATI
jgi:hypothetical protein